MQNIDDIGNGICGRRWLSRVLRGVMLHALRSHPSYMALATLMIITMVLLMLMVVKWKMLKQEVHYANKIGPSVSSSQGRAHGHSLLRALQLAQSFSHIPIFHMYKFYAYQSYPVLKRKYLTCMQYFYSGIMKIRGRGSILYSFETICEILRFRQIDCSSILSEL